MLGKRNVRVSKIIVPDGFGRALKNWGLQACSAKIAAHLLVEKFCACESNFPPSNWKSTSDQLSLSEQQHDSELKTYCRSQREN